MPIANQKLQPWIDARKRYRLTDAQVQMARELGLTPKSLSKITPNKDQQWKVPIPEYIEYLYEKRFKRALPLEVVSIEQRTKQLAVKAIDKKNKKRLAELTGEI